MKLEFYKGQYEALHKLHNGCILCGGVGSGKSRTALAYYYERNGGRIGDEVSEGVRELRPMTRIAMDLYVITTAKKRDSREWEEEFLSFGISSDPETSYFRHTVVVDSWNDIQKYKDVENAFFIFDEQRVVGWGVWAKTFVKIAAKNQWILLSATPGDKWHDYVPVFVANGFFTGKTDFENKHVRWSRYCTKYPKVESYLGIPELIEYRDQILVDIPCERHTERHYETVHVTYDANTYRAITKNRWNPFTDKPIKDAAELCRVMRRIVDEDESRQVALLEILEKKRKLIVFYNFDYELEILRNLDYGENVEVAEWNGHKHQPIPTGSDWVYLVQYAAGAEGWNCITTNCIVFYSQSYSYKMTEQASGRIDRMNTPYRDLYYYKFISAAGIDQAIKRSLDNKKKFNEQKYGDKFLSAMDKHIISQIQGLRRKLMVNAYAYYEYENPLLRDSQWDSAARELYRLQEAYPTLSEKANMYLSFADFDACRGSSIHRDQPHYEAIARKLIIEQKEGGLV